ncbi:hypothetical protein JCM6882_007332 [Rhodosporidiobolus microsporus]
MSRGLSDSLGALDLDADPSLGVALVLSALEADDRPAAQDVADELQSLAAIFDSEAGPCLSLYHPPTTSRTSSPPRTWSPSSQDPLRLVLTTTLASPHDDTPLHLLLSIPPTYPTDAPPLIQLQDRYLSSFAVSDELFGAVLRTFMHDAEAAVAGSTAVVEWQPGGVCLFEGIEAVREMCASWVGERAEEKKRGEEARRAEAGETVADGARRRNGAAAREYEDDEEEDLEERIEEQAGRAPRSPPKSTVKCPKITSSEPLIDRKSVFVGHAATVNSVDEVQAVMAELLSNSKIARATHNISAYQFTTPDGIRRADNDDDGETAAGSRLAQLLTLLDVPNVMVVVTRWYGGVHLGPGRFKDINLAAREALSAGGYLPEEGKEKDGKGGKGGGKKK